MFKLIKILISFSFMFLGRIHAAVNFRIKAALGYPKTLYFSDSRGFLVGSYVGYKNHFRNNIVGRFHNKFAVKIEINKHSHTTLADLFYEYSIEDLNSFDFLIIHLGVVEFSPRRNIDAVAIRNDKLEKLGRVKITKGSSVEKGFLQALNARTEAIYENDVTDSIVNADLYKKYMEKLQSVNVPIIALTTQTVLDDWRGNYWRARPSNMNSFLALEREFWKSVTPYVIQVPDDECLIKKFTMDNIHPTKLGFKYLSDEVDRVVQEINKK